MNEAELAAADFRRAHGIERQTDEEEEIERLQTENDRLRKVNYLLASGQGWKVSKENKWRRRLWTRWCDDCWYTLDEAFEFQKEIYDTERPGKAMEIWNHPIYH